MKSGLRSRDAVGKPALDALGERREPLVGRHAGPAQRERDFAFTVLNLERRDGGYGSRCASASASIDIAIS